MKPDCDSCNFAVFGGEFSVCSLQHDVNVNDTEYIAECPLETDCFDFAAAFTAMKMGKNVARKGWKSGVWINIKPKNNKAYLFRNTTIGSIPYWIPSPTDIMAEDWHIHKAGGV